MMDTFFATNKRFILVEKQVKKHEVRILGIANLSESIEHEKGLPKAKCAF